MTGLSSCGFIALCGLLGLLAAVWFVAVTVNVMFPGWILR